MKLTKENKCEANINNVKFLALTYGKKNSECFCDEKDTYYPEDSMMKLRITNENMFKHRAAPINFKNRNIYNNGRTLEIKNHIQALTKEITNMNVFITSKGIIDLPPKYITKQKGDVLSKFN